MVTLRSPWGDQAAVVEAVDDETRGVTQHHAAGVGEGAWSDTSSVRVSDGTGGGSGVPAVGGVSTGRGVASAAGRSAWACNGRSGDALTTAAGGSAAGCTSKEAISVHVVPGLGRTGSAARSFPAGRDSAAGSASGGASSGASFSPAVGGSETGKGGSAGAGGEGTGTGASTVGGGDGIGTGVWTVTGGDGTGKGGSAGAGGEGTGTGGSAGAGGEGTGTGVRAASAATRVTRAGVFAGAIPGVLSSAGSRKPSCPRRSANATSCSAGSSSPVESRTQGMTLPSCRPSNASATEYS